MKLPLLHQHKDSTLKLCTGAHLRLCERSWNTYANKQMVL